MLSLRDNTLVFEFPTVNPTAKTWVSFRRTLRVPDNHQTFFMPPDFGPFRVGAIDDFAHRLPEEWRVRGGVFLPLYQSEALWLKVDSDYPCAVKVAAGKVNVLTGAPWQDALSESGQDYFVTTAQKWIDGFHIDEGVVRQFVSMPLGGGSTAEELLTGVAEHGGIQIAVYPMKRGAFDRHFPPPKPPTQTGISLGVLDIPAFSRVQHDVGESEMGVMPGGAIKQIIARDPYGIASWDQQNLTRCFVHLLNSSQFQAVTGQPLPHRPFDARVYAQNGLPWFFEDITGQPLPPTERMRLLERLAARFKQDYHVLDEGQGIGPMSLKPGVKRRIR